MSGRGKGKGKGGQEKKNVSCPPPSCCLPPPPQQQQQPPHLPAPVSHPPAFLQVSKSTKAGLQFPVGRIARYLKKGRYAEVGDWAGFVWVYTHVWVGCGRRQAAGQDAQLPA